MNQSKITELQETLQKNGADLAYVADPGRIAYLSGYSSDPHERILALFIPAVGNPFLFTPALEIEDAQNSSWAYDVLGYLDSENPWQMIKEAIVSRYQVPKKIALEKNALTLDRFEILQSLFSGCDFSMDITSTLQQLMLIKTDSEIKTMTEAGAWADEAFRIGFNGIKAGVPEAEIVAEIEYQLKKQGVAQMSFDTIVLAGENAASPHGVPGTNQIKENELVLFDLGVIWKGYCSDATRTVAYKEPTAFQKEIYDLTLLAQETAQKAVRPGVTAAQLDAIARDVITEAGYGEYFNHRLGHGIGTTVHEFPSLVAGNDLVIEKGMCFSLEPGIYIPGKVGVRIEDCVYVTDDGCVPFTKTSKELMILD